MGTALDMDHIASALGAERRGKVVARGGYFGALQMAAQLAARHRVTEGGELPADPSRSEQCLLRLSPRTLEQLEKLAERAHSSPMQVAALLLERAVQTAAGQG
jgi:hypothetical protein